MSKKILSVIDTAYRATLEEQDDSSLWFNHACVLADAKIDILLTGNAVNYMAKNQSSKALKIGKKEVAHPSDFGEDILGFEKTGQKVFFLEEDLFIRGLSERDLIKSFAGLKRDQLAKFIESYDLVWHW